MMKLVVTPLVIVYVAVAAFVAPITIRKHCFNSGGKRGPLNLLEMSTLKSDCFLLPSSPTSGYSRGAMVVHSAVKFAGLSPDSVSSAVVYAAPQDGEGIASFPASKTKVWPC